MLSCSDSTALAAVDAPPARESGGDPARAAQLRLNRGGQRRGVQSRRWDVRGPHPRR
jgi:hypothetical protein